MAHGLLRPLRWLQQTFLLSSEDGQVPAAGRKENQVSSGLSSQLHTCCTSAEPAPPARCWSQSRQTGRGGGLRGEGRAPGVGRDAGNVSGGPSKGVRILTLRGRGTHRGRPGLGKVARAGKGEVAQSLGVQQVSTEEAADLEPPGRDLCFSLQAGGSPSQSRCSYNTHPFILLH